MTKESGKKDYWKEILLVLVGGLLASVPTLISTQMQGKAQLHQFVLDRQINALKDYSTSSHKMATEIILGAENFERHVEKYESDYKAGRIKSDNIEENLLDDFQSLQAKLLSSTSEVNSQTIVVNALFNENFQQHPLPNFDDANGAPRLESIPFEQRMKRIKEKLADVRKNSIQIINIEQDRIKELEKRIERN
jgi:hypothetical protein